MSKDLTTWKELAQMKVAKPQPLPPPPSAPPPPPPNYPCLRSPGKWKDLSSPRAFLPAQEGLVTTPPVSSHISYFPEGIPHYYNQRLHPQSHHYFFNLGVQPWDQKSSFEIILKIWTPVNSNEWSLFFLLRKVSAHNFKAATIIFLKN